MREQYDLVVIGAGCAGTEAAREGARRGLRTALIAGVGASGAALGGGADAVTVVNGPGRVAGPGLVASGDRELAGGAIVLATGSRPAPPPGVTADGERVLTAAQLLDGRPLPAAAVVAGGGAGGVEIAGVLADLGCRVTLVEMMDRLLPGEDSSLGDCVAAALARQGVEVRLAHRVIRAEAVTAGVAVTLLDVAGRREVATMAPVLALATGWRPASRDLGLETVTVETDRRGHVLVDGFCETSTPRLFAIGDLVPTIAGAAVARLEARVAVARAAGEAVAPIAYRLQPRWAATRPAIGAAGLGRSQAEAEGYHVRVGRRDLPQGDGGFAQVVVDAETDLLLGCQVAGPGAGELVAAAAVALAAGLRAAQLVQLAWPHGTLAAALEHALRDAAAGPGS